jgi:ATP-dependent helicase/nuclease subunit A
MNILQLKASDPELSTWVSASAGTGKTKILTDRVLRLLLQDIPFNKILCLTFTNAATSEMHERIISSLEKWSKLSPEDLSHNLKNTLGRGPSSKEIVKASTLFEAYLKTQEQINIYTIHSFCQKILKKFPLEASISPNFKIIDENKVYQIIKKIKKQIFNLPDIQPISRFFAENFHELTINEIFNEIISVKAKILEKRLSCAQVNEDLFTQGPSLIEALAKTQAIDYLKAIKDQEVRELILSSLNLISEEEIKYFFLTSDGSRKKRIVTKNIASPDSALYKKLETAQEKIYLLDQEAKTKHLLLYSKLLALIAEKIIAEFETYKKKSALLDYDDLIIYTQNLLTNSYAKEWVLYKLDGGIDHLLVDEAQDTSKSQWRIIEALIEEFYSGESNNHQNRTIFVVGDEKQSIFSFQGADINAFSYMNKFLHEKLAQGKKLFETINLDISYRSTKEILTIVTDIFNKIIINNPSDFTDNLREMIAHRNNHPGSVQLWPLSTNENKDSNSLIWSLHPEDTTNNGKSILAKKIAAYVKDQINSGQILHATGKQISAQDFMILFRTRDDFTDEVIEALKKAEIAITGLDKITLTQDLGVVDLLSIAKFVLNPNDDLNLAALLKSPIFGVSEEELYDLVIKAHDKKKNIWELIASSPPSPIHQTLQEFLLLYKALPLTDFFLYLTDVLNYRDIISHNDEAIDEFLKLSRNYLLEYESGMQNFIYWFEENEISIKKDQDTKNKVRIMTIHGAKGLQAPIVILCDTAKIPNNSERFIWGNNDEILSSLSSSYIPEFYEKLKDQERQKAYQEYLRLLYVGLTRAEDHLIICGYQGTNQIPEKCWYNLAKNSMQELGNLNDNGVWMYGNELSLEASSFGQSNHEAPEPSWHTTSWKRGDLVTLKYAPPIKLARPLNSLAMSISTNNATEYGLVFHKILEDALGSKNLTDTHPLIETLPAQSKQRISSSLQKLMANKEFTELLKYDLKTELSFGYKAGSEMKIGRVDLVVMRENQVIIIDYKSDRKPAKDIQSIPESYVTQLAFYLEAFKEIYPNKTIKCKILWLENGNIMDVL